MVRRLLSVLALLPLLLPPGVCVCHAPVTAGTAGGVDGERPAPLVHVCLGHGGPGSHTPGGPHGHAPGCPATRGVDHWVATPGTAAQVPALTLAGPVVPFDTASRLARTAATAPRLDSPDEPPPLYVSLHTLLI
jgi:hypothetical protein